MRNYITSIHLLAEYLFAYLSAIAWKIFCAVFILLSEQKRIISIYTLEPHASCTIARNVNKTINDDINNGAYEYLVEIQRTSNRSLQNKQTTRRTKKNHIFENISIAFLVWHMRICVLQLMQ